MTKKRLGGKQGVIKIHRYWQKDRQRDRQIENRQAENTEQPRCDEKDSVRSKEAQNVS